MGSVSFSTGALLTGTILGGGTFAGGGTFDVVGVGSWAAKLTGAVGCGAGCPLFTGTFVGPISWTVVSHTGLNNYVFALSGTIQGTLNGRSVTGTTKQIITVYQNQWLLDNEGGIQLSGSNLAVPEPGTLGLLATGLIGIAGTVRRRFLGIIT